MKRNILILIAVVMGFSLAASAGTISGQVSGVAGQSVVYVDTISGKTFPAPPQHPVIDQKGLVFQPHVSEAVTAACSPFDFRAGPQNQYAPAVPHDAQDAKRPQGDVLEIANRRADD